MQASEWLYRHLQRPCRSRVVGYSFRVECLDQFVIVGERHLRYLVREFVEHYNTERPHQSRGNVPLPEAERADAGEPAILSFPTGTVQCRERLGGVLKHYYRDAAA